jgi:hypothetical protein
VVDEPLDPPPTSEKEEIQRRAVTPLAVLVVWYLQHGMPLDVPLRPYVPRGSDG